MLAKATEYAIRALVYVQLQNWNNKRPGGIEIAREIEAPQAFTAKILQILTRHKFLESMKGRGGGFFFPENQSHSTLYDVVHVMEGDGCFHKCGFGLKNCTNNSPCPLHDRYVVVRNNFFDLAKTDTIASLSTKIVEGTAILNRKNEVL